MKTRFFLPILTLIAGLLLAALVLSASMVWQSASAADTASFTLSILHTNDVHSHYNQYSNDGSICTDEANCLSGVARMKTLIDQLRISEPNSILVDAGDQFQGTLYYKLFKADIVTLTMNTLGYQAMAIGNHEFDDGPQTLANLVDGVTFPVLGTNLDVSAEPTLAGKLFTITVITVGGEDIGLIGLTTPDTSFLSKPGPNVVFNDPAASAQNAVNTLQTLGVDKIIALTHLGYNEDIALAQTVDGLDVIVGGHSHTFVYTPTLPVSFTPPSYPKTGTLTPAGPYPTLVNAPNGDPVLITTEYCWATFFGLIRVTFDDMGKVTTFQGNPIYMSNTIVKDPTVVNMMKPYDDKVKEIYATIVGTTTVDLPVLVNGKQVCRTGECLLGDLINDAILWKVNATASPDLFQDPRSVAEPYQISLLNGGSLRAPLSGTISVGDILDVLPFGNSIATFEITGTHLISALENGLSRYGAVSGSGRFPQVAGIRYIFNPQYQIGSLLISVEVRTLEGYAPIDPAHIYRVATNDYVRTGGDGYTIFRDFAIHPYDYGPPLDETLEDYIQMLGTIDPDDIQTDRIFLSYRFLFPWVASQGLPR
jgi:5'-nucleotidase/UDP-sugar diphosphatase